MRNIIFMKIILPIYLTLKIICDLDFDVCVGTNDT